jgi:transposase-like protein
MARKYKSHAASLKVKVALEAIGNEKTTSQIISEYQVSSSQVTEWKGQLLEEAEKFFQGKSRRKSVEAHEDVEYLQQQIGKLTTQIEWLKKKHRMES